MLVVHVEPRERPPIQEMVHINYIRENAQHQLQLSERPRSSDGTAWEHPSGTETVERNGRSYQVTRRPPGRFGPPTTLFFERAATSIQMSSSDLELETMLDLAESLRPAS
jgi:hypothetical protein